MDLKSLMIDSKAVWMDFPGLEGFEVQVKIFQEKDRTKSLRKTGQITKKSYERQRIR